MSDKNNENKKDNEQSGEQKKQSANQATPPSTEVKKAEQSQMPTEKVNSKDLRLLNDLNAALQVEKHTGSFAMIWLLGAFLVVFLIWSYFSKIEEVTRGQGTIIPNSREQIIQSLDPGILDQMMVHEGDLVEKGQVLLKLDDTRSSAILRETQAKVDNLEAITTRLKAEISGQTPVFSEKFRKRLKIVKWRSIKRKNKHWKRQLKLCVIVKLILIPKLP